MEGSRALARGEFEHEIPIDGKDELAQLGTVFNETAGRLRHLYDDLRGREVKLRESEHELRQLVEFAPTHVFVLSSQGTGIYASRVVLDYYGLTMEDWLGNGVPERIVHSEDIDRYLAERNKGLAGEAPFEVEVRRRRKDGAYRWFVSRFNPMHDEKGNIVRWYVAQSDIEEAKLSAQRTENENLALREEVDRSSMFEEIVGSSQKLLRVLSDVGRVAPTDSTVLIFGETGTGKELIARAIHKQSNRARRAFIRVNCATIPASLISSELFGHEKGAFTGAFQRRLGRFEAADGGTIFLDEIGELPAETTGFVVARLARTRVRTPRQQSAHRNRRSNSCGDQSKPQSRGRRRNVSVRLVLSPERFPDPDPFPARTRRRHSAARRISDRSLRKARRQEDPQYPKTNAGLVRHIRLARKHPRTAKCRRARRATVRRRNIFGR